MPQLLQRPRRLLQGLLRHLLLLTLLPPFGAWAQPADPLRSPACLQAMQALQGVETGLAARPGSPAASGAVPAALQAARRQAAHACLGTRLDAAPPAGRHAQPPISVPPITLPPPAGNTTLPLPSRSPAATAQPLPRMPNAPLNSITACDANGCWSSDGTRLQRQGGGQLLGPRGYCTVTGAVVTCP